MWLSSIATKKISVTPFLSGASPPKKNPGSDPVYSLAQFHVHGLYPNNFVVLDSVCK